MLRNVFVVFTEELRQVLRDRRTLIFMIALPLFLVPVLGNLAVDFMSDAAQEASSKTLRYATVGAEHAPELDDEFVTRDGFEPVVIESTEAIGDALETGAIDFALVVHPPDDGAPQTIELHWDNAPVMSKVRSRVGDVIETYNEHQRDDRLAALGVRDSRARAAVLEPIVLAERGTASARELLGERVGGMLPYLFIVFCFLGALYPATDLGAGEKERGTLETLLLAPVSRFELVVGKFGVVFVTGAVCAILGTASFGIWLATGADAVSGTLGEVVRSIDPGDLAIIGALLVPVAATFASLLLSVSIYAKSFKEAQSYMAPMNIVVLLPAFVGMLPGVELDVRWALVPIANVSLAIKELVKGSADPALLALVFASSFVLAASLLAFCRRWFDRESVLFRT